MSLRQRGWMGRREPPSPVAEPVLPPPAPAMPPVATAPLPPTSDGRQVVVWPARVCPTCGARRLKQYGGRKAGDGHPVLYYRCQVCECKFLVVEQA